MRTLSKRLIDSVKLHEGLRLKTYLDTVGVPTIGYGTNLLKLQITQKQAEEWLIEELQACSMKLYDLPQFTEIKSSVRKEVIIEMAYNLGIDGLLKFKKMWASIAVEDWVKAAQEGLNSKWATQVGKRARTLMKRLETGEW